MRCEIVLIEPEIPHNTGNISRTCVALGAPLHICGEPGFSLSDKAVKRAGLDYWHDLDLHLWNDFEELYRNHSHAYYYYATTKGGRVYSEIAYEDHVMLVFGKETKGLPESMLLAHPERCVRIPMLTKKRSLNLSNAVAIIAYEVLRQHGFAGLETMSDFFTNHL
ncbi:MAG: tRNA (cytidine(34)-2'-O)-methyltransferase [Fastidiosipilaceae bacterium]|jgi:tRNA (cytidine/uridine-2'-O-)-methyltransferase